MIENESAEPEYALVNTLRSDAEGQEIPVRVSLDIIRLFSEGLYQSPHKAIEELVTNGFDAGATRAHVMLPRPADDDDGLLDSLWVIDDGTGMDGSGFEALWRVADSDKYDAGEVNGRLPIGQFGIGKLAAYVLAWRLTHISKVGTTYRYTSMDFHSVTGRQYEEYEPPTVTLYEIEKEEAMRLLRETEKLDPSAWEMMFGVNSWNSWTAAALSDFKDLFGKLRAGTLAWVLRTALPLSNQFTISLNGSDLEPSRTDYETILEITIGSAQDEAADALGLKRSDGGIVIPGLDGIVKGQARLFLRSLSGGKADQYGRSRGFFIRVRRRVINLEDELFGLDALNHAAWARFAMDIEADGLRDHLLSSREGVRESDPIFTLREYLHLVFNQCRNAYDKASYEELVGLDIAQLLSEAPHSALIRPVIEAVRSKVMQSGETFYIEVPPDLEENELEDWLEDYERKATAGPFASMDVESDDPYTRLVRYEAEGRRLRINESHPFLSRIQANSKNQTPMALFASSEILTDALLRDVGVDSQTAFTFLRRRDRALRMIAGDYGPDPKEVLRKLDVAHQDQTALEVAVGLAFEVLGFRYEPRGRTGPGCDGILDATLGVSSRGIADYRVIYDAKQTDAASVAASKVDLAAVRQFMMDEEADFGFVVAKAFQGQDNPESSLNKRLASQPAGTEESPERRVSALLTEDVKRLVELHYKFGLPLSRLRDLFESATTLHQTKVWVDALEIDLENEPKVPLRILLDGLEAEREDKLARPNIFAVRAKHKDLKTFEPGRLSAALAAVATIVGPRWLEVDTRSGVVTMHHSASEIASEVERALAETLDLDEVT